MEKSIAFLFAGEIIPINKILKNAFEVYEICRCVS